MSLNWNIADTTAYKNKADYENFTFIVDAVVFATMCVDIGQIKNQELAGQYVDRILLLEDNFGFLYQYKNKSLLADRDLITAFIGLHTNVQTLKFNKWYQEKIIKRRADLIGGRWNDNLNRKKRNAILKAV